MQPVVGQQSNVNVRSATEVGTPGVRSAILSSTNGLELVVVFVNQPGIPWIDCCAYELQPIVRVLKDAAQCGDTAFCDQRHDLFMSAP
jgi:hypothetical protein|eukprot:COSAG06_NODE_1611_length_8936_cov_2.495078_4_plen_88_part_00